LAVGDLIRNNAGAGHDASDPSRGSRPFLRYDDTIITHAEYYAACRRWAALFLRLRRAASDATTAAPTTAPFHIGVLLDNVPEYFFALGAAALAGAVIVGINNTKRGTHLARDIAYTDCSILLTEASYLPLLDPVRAECGVAADRILVTGELDDVLDAEVAGDPHVEVGDRDPFVLLFTSGTVTTPKAVVCSHGRLVETGKNIGANVYQMTADDVGYIAMPLFHANALMCGYMPALYYGASLGMARKFSKSRWLTDIRRYGATFFNYTGKPLAYVLSTPRQADDAHNPLRICYGNEGSHQVVTQFEERFGCRVVDVFGSSEGGAGVTRQPGDPPSSIGMPAPGIVVVDSDGNEMERARFDEHGRLANAEEAVGEIVNTQGIGWFEGYYKNDEAFRVRTRGGWYWTGDLGYRDEAGYLYFAGRDIEWIRVDGENFVARPIEEILQRHDPVVLSAVYGVPDPDGGDRVMAALAVKDPAHFDLEAFARFLQAQPDLSPKWRPTYVRIAADLPHTATAKILKTTLRQQKFRLDRGSDAIYWRARHDEEFRRFGEADFEQLKSRFEAAGRLQQLDL